MPKTFIRAADQAERAALARCICGGQMEIERGLYFVTLTCPVCGWVQEWTRAEWAQYADPMDEVD